MSWRGFPTSDECGFSYNLVRYNFSRRLKAFPSSSSSSASDHEYGQYNRLTSSAATPQSGRRPTQHTIYLTPSSSNNSSSGTSSGGRGSGNVGEVGGLGGLVMVPPPKSEARRRLNLDAATVDPEGFKTPIKGGGSRRRGATSDLSSPSPKKSKEGLALP